MKRIFFAAAALALASCTPPAYADPIRLCTGGEGGVYYAAGKIIQEFAGGSSNLIVVPSQGTIDNIDKTLSTNECDAMIGQPDGPAYLQRTSPAKVKALRQIASLHREYLHVICGKDSRISDLSDLSGGKKGRLMVGEANSGSWLVWQNIIHEDKGYESVPTGTESGILALSAVSSGDAACMLLPSGIHNATAEEAARTFADTLFLAGANDKDFNDAMGIDGKPLYTYVSIPKNTYPRPFQKGNISTISWLAGVYVNTEAFQDKAKLTKLVTAVSRAAVNIKAEYGK